MIAESELRELMVRMGYSSEEINAACETRNYLESVQKKMEEMAALLRQYMSEALGEILGTFEVLAEYASEIELPKKKINRRPPRCIGPKNKAPQRVPRPARVARSSCRKFKKHRWRANKGKSRGPSASGHHTTLERAQHERKKRETAQARSPR